jgi:hypothetical protein
MIHAKSLLAGVVALIVAAPITWAILFLGQILKSLTARCGDVRVAAVRFHPLPTLGVALLVFASGLYWQYRRAVKQFYKGYRLETQWGLPG